MKDLEINASSCLWLFNCPASCWFPERFALSVGLTFQLMLLLSWLKWPASSGWKYWCHASLQHSKAEEEQIMFCSCLISWRKWALKGLRQTCKCVSFFLFSILFTSCSHNIFIMISMFFLQADQNLVDHLCHTLTREMVWSQYRRDSQTQVERGPQRLSGPSI